MVLILNINTKLRKIIHNTFLNMFETLDVLVIFLLRGPQKVCALAEPHLKFAESHLKSHLQVQVAGNLLEIEPERVAEASQTKQTERPRVLPQCHRNQQYLSLLSKFVLRQVQVVYFQVSVNSCCSQYMPYLVLNVKVRVPVAEIFVRENVCDVRATDLLAH